MARQISTIKDIAAELGISPSTVSRVLNKRGYFSPDVAERVERLVEESGFVYNQTARGLRNARSGIIGCMVPDISNQYYGVLALHVEEYLSARGYSLIICNTGGDRARGREQLANLASARVEGIICISTITDAPVNFDRRGIPVVGMVHPPIGLTCHTSIVTNDRQMGREVGELLLSRGCRSVYVFGRLVARYLDGSMPGPSLDGLVEALEAGGIALPNDHFVEVPRGGIASIEAAEHCVYQLLEQGHEPDGVFAMTDRYALGVLNGLYERDILVPRDVKLVGYDDISYSSASRPRITSVNRDPEHMAHAACQRLLEIIENGVPADPETIVVPGHLVERESTAPVDAE